MLAAIPLTDDERAAVDDGQAALDSLLGLCSPTSPVDHQAGEARPQRTDDVPLLCVAARALGCVEVVRGYPLSDPRAWFPRPSDVMPVASAAASPPLDAPAVRDRSHGFTVAPHSSLSVCQPIAKPGREAREIGVADRDPPPKHPV